MSTPSPDLAATHRLAAAALPLWPIPVGAALRLINVSENTTFLVEAPGYRSVLRVHRPRYHSRCAIECELAWMAALTTEGAVAVPTSIDGHDGAAIQTLNDDLDGERHMVMFAFIDGDAPDETANLAPNFHTLGAIAARTHQHSTAWTRPDPFERLNWNLSTVFGNTPTWGDWRAAPNLTISDRAVLEDVETAITARLSIYGCGADRYGLIHADMRLANLILTPTGPRLIDFDDCGFGWFMYDFAAAISFIEDSPQVPTLIAAWVAGYRSIRELSAANEAEIGTMVMLRRLALLAWIGSHMDAPEPQALAPDFARVSAELGARWLGGL